MGNLRQCRGTSETRHTNPTLGHTHAFPSSLTALSRLQFPLLGCTLHPQGSRGPGAMAAGVSATAGVWGAVNPGIPTPGEVHRLSHSREDGR